jgi:hypothetical protein
MYYLPEHFSQKKPQLASVLGNYLENIYFSRCSDACLMFFLVLEQELYKKLENKAT